MSQLGDLKVVIATSGANGDPCFIDSNSAVRHSVEGAVEAAFVWGVDGVPDLKSGIGAVPKDMSFPGPGGSKFGLICFPPHSAGKLDVPADLADVDEGKGGMHQSDTIDYEVIISGKVDIVLPSGDRRTLTPGMCLVMGGVMHAWENVYDEPCIYAAIVIGARR